MSAVNRGYEIAAAVYPDPRKLYEKDEWYYEDPYRKYRGAALGFVFGILTKMSNNYIKDRPLRAGIHLYPVYAVGFSVATHIIAHIGYGYYSYRERINRHYVATHPDDFPPPPKVKIAEKWEPWHPTR